jgi:HSP20 family protein
MFIQIAGRQGAGHSKLTRKHKEMPMNNLALWSRPAWDTDRWLRDFFGPAATADWFKPVTSGASPAFNPAAEIVKDGDDAMVRLELPGVDVDKDVNVEVDKGRLVIHGEHRDEHSEAQNGRTLREIRYGSFRRSFQLPTHVTSEAIAASYDAGVLTVRVTGAFKDPAGTQAQRIAITK